MISDVSALPNVRDDSGRSREGRRAWRHRQLQTMHRPQHLVQRELCTGTGPDAMRYQCTAASEARTESRARSTPEVYMRLVGKEPAPAQYARRALSTASKRPRHFSLRNTHSSLGEYRRARRGGIG
jgi:hypothetical protein